MKAADNADASESRARIVATSVATRRRRRSHRRRLRLQVAAKWTPRPCSLKTCCSKSPRLVRDGRRPSHTVADAAAAPCARRSPTPPPLRRHVAHNGRRVRARLNGSPNNDNAAASCRRASNAARVHGPPQPNHVVVGDLQPAHHMRPPQD